MTYRDVVSRQVLTWACTAIGARMPVAMAPLALVFLVRERPGVTRWVRWPRGIR